MTYAIIADIHANADALRRVLKDARSCGAEKIICLGDIVGYGPLPHEALGLIRKHAATILAGNHDDAVSGRMSDKDFIELAGDAIHRHRTELSREELDFLAALPYTVEIEGAKCSHGEFVDPKAFGYLDTDEVAKANFNAATEQLLFVGHTHIPEIRVAGSSGVIHTLPPQDFVAEAGKRYIVNVGSIGYPRESNGACYSSYVLYESETRTVRYRLLPFAVASLLQRGCKPRRPVRLIATLAATILLLGFGAFYYLHSTPSGRTESIIPPPPAKSAPKIPAPLVEKALTLSPSHHYVHANLKLERKSPSAHLSIEFENAAGAQLFTLAEVVPYWSRKAFDIPGGATKATFRVRAAKKGAKPQIKSFAPTAD